MIPQPCHQLVTSKTSPERCIRCEHPADAHNRQALEPKPKTTHIWGDTIRPDVCKSCRRQIYWAISVDREKSIPFDVRPVAISKAPEIQTGREKWLVNLATVHWATCPFHDQHRRKR